MNKLLVVLLGCMPLLASAAGVYKWVDEQGVVHYSDKPHQGAEKMQLPKTPAASPPPRRPVGFSRDDDDDSGEIGGAYSAFSIAQPDNNQTIRSNEGLINISFFIQPGLQSGHKIRIFVDGRPLKDELSSPNFALRGISRGTHSLRAEIINEEGDLMAKTDPVTFHLRKESILDQATPPPQPGSGNFEPDYEPGAPAGYAPGPKPNYKPSFKPNYTP